MPPLRPIFLITVFLLSCTRMYTLPDAPPQDKWENKSIEEQENPEEAMQRFLDAKRASIQVYAALSDKDWEKALSLMSAETVALFTQAAPSGDPKEALNAGVLEIRDQSIPFDPVSDVFIADLSDIRGDFADLAPEASKTRQVLYAVDTAKRARKIVMIKEGGKWVLHSPTIKSPLLEEE